MKKMTCLDCDKEFVADTSENMMNTMHPHYMEDHKDMMEEGTEEKKKLWMEAFHKKWEEAEEI